MTKVQSGIVRWSVRCIGFVIFGYLLHRIGPENLWRAIRGVQPVYFLAALPVFFFMIGVKTLKMRALLRSPIGFSELFDLNAFGFSIGSITPGRLGEFSKIIFLNRLNVPVAESFAVTLVDRMSDVALMLVCAVGGLFVFFGPPAGWLGVAAVAAATAAAGSLWFSDRVLRKLTWGKLRELVTLEGATIRAFLARVPPGVWAAAAALTVAYLGLYFLQMWILAKGLNLPITYVQTTMAISASAVPAILPISVFNVGPRDAVLAAIFSRMGWGAENGVALSTLILALFLVNGCFGLLFVPRETRP
ncbi:MAG: hypothetical protein A3G34_09735 [Candidatus Lindowbacteria bacterium RIFCSPLOWO2_12_FULL_62_27]|nr:MAG: hypothetical protein A3G34_09735 [Candidatus Lindowbacteria bacterium RIFCSPLOWO2_12_FULL_62_27]OGH61526.1 MAG: hypothetical protein A3I06_02735 [Candidatus Lindowbacteria bacterium RIFCSPLOWO2_02_FULL_62_12]